MPTEREVPVPGFVIVPSMAKVSKSDRPAAESVIADTISAELLAGFRAWRIWMILGWDDIRQRYRRSVLGPFWITLSTGMFILLLGIIYSRLFHMELQHYMPYLSV